MHVHLFHSTEQAKHALNGRTYRAATLAIYVDYPAKPAKNSKTLAIGTEAQNHFATDDYWDIKNDS